METSEQPASYTTRYDHAARRQSKRAGRERGVWIYVPAAELLAAGIDPNAPAPTYRTAGRQRSKNGHAVMVDLYAVAPAEPDAAECSHGLTDCPDCDTSSPVAVMDSDAARQLAEHRNRLRAGAEILDSDYA